MPFLGAWLLLAMGLGLRARGWLSRKRREAGGARPVQGMTAWRNPGRCRPSLPRHCGATLWAQAWREKTSPAPCHTERDRRGGVGRSPGRARLADRLHAHAGRVRPKPMPLLAFRLSKLDEPAPSWGGEALAKDPARSVCGPSCDDQVVSQILGARTDKDWGRDARLVLDCLKCPYRGGALETSAPSVCVASFWRA